ncbi:MAG: hypothetical protein U0457_04205 [Candidatus Sericytochromatia bacterium]
MTSISSNISARNIDVKAIDPVKTKENTPIKVEQESKIERINSPIPLTPESHRVLNIIETGISEFKSGKLFSDFKLDEIGKIAGNVTKSISDAASKVQIKIEEASSNNFLDKIVSGAKSALSAVFGKNSELMGLIDKGDNFIKGKFKELDSKVKDINFLKDLKGALDKPTKEFVSFIKKSENFINDRLKDLKIKPIDFSNMNKALDQLPSAVDKMCEKLHQFVKDFSSKGTLLIKKAYEKGSDLTKVAITTIDKKSQEVVNKVDNEKKKAVNTFKETQKKVFKDLKLT